MNLANNNGTKCLCLVTILSMVLLLSFVQAAPAAGSEGVQYYKMLSSVEYTGRGQFRNQAQTLFTVKKEFLSDDEVKYFLSTSDFNLVENPGQELSFVVDRKTKHISGEGRDLMLFEKINNECVKSFKKVTKENIGKTWQQTFELSSLDTLLPREMKFTLSAIQLKTKVFGQIIAVRALSEPFAFNIAKEAGGTGAVQSRINAVYLFDPEIEDIYMSISAFEATTNVNGFSEKLRHEIATYKTSSKGVSADFSGLGKDFEKFVKDLGLSREGIKVVKASPLPRWARSEGLGAAEVANICASTACEGAVNPVATVCIPAGRTIAMQSLGKLGIAVKAGTVSGLLVSNVPAIGGMKIAAVPAFMGAGLGPAGVAAAGGGVAVAAGGSSGSSSDNVSSPSQP